MAFEWDNWHEKTWLRWCQPGSVRVETKRRVAGSALHVDLVVWGAIGSIQPALDFVPDGMVAIENKWQSTILDLADVVGFHGRIGLLLEREVEDTGRLPDLEATTGIVLCSRLSRRLAAHAGLAGATIAPGIRQVTALRPRLYLVVADELEPASRNGAIVLYYGGDEAVERLIRVAPEEAFLPHLPWVWPLRRIVLERALRERGIHMSSGATIPIREVVDNIGFRAVIDAYGLKAVIEEVGLKAVIAELGLKAVIAEVGLKTVIEEVGLKTVLSQYGRDHVLQLLREMEESGE